MLDLRKSGINQISKTLYLRDRDQNAQHHDQWHVHKNSQPIINLKTEKITKSLQVGASLPQYPVQRR